MAAEMANPKDRIDLLLDGVFVKPSTRCKYRVTLTTDLLYYTRLSQVEFERKEKAVRINDIVGCHSRSISTGFFSRDQSNDNSAGFTIFAYPCQKGVFYGTGKRHRMEKTFQTCNDSTKEENEKLVQKWKNVINCRAKGLPVDSSDVEVCKLPPLKRLLVLVNPVSGTGKAMKIFSTEVAPMLEEASMHFQVFVTEYAGHASELMKDMELSQWAGVVVVSGDGLVHEVINGIMQRTDWDSAIKLPIGCIPAGSCNALVSSINYAAAEPVTVNTVLHSAFVLVKHSVVPVDLVMVQTQSTQFYSFLSLTWGLIADANLESQKYRFLEAMKGLFNMTVHRGTLSFLPAADLSSWSSVDTADMFFKRNQDDEGQVHLFADNMADWGRKQSTDMLAQKTPLAIGDHGKHKVGGEGAEAFSGETATNVPMARALTSHVSQSVASDESRFGAVDPLLQNILESKGQAKEEKGDKGKSVGSTHESVHCDLLPPLHQPVGRDWVVFKGGFLMVCALFQSHIGRDLFLAPFSRLSDEVIHLMIIREDISRYRLLKLMMSFHKGTHIRCPEVQFVTVSAFRLEPGDYAGQIMVDGQRVEAGPLQAQVLPGMARVMAMK